MKAYPIKSILKSYKFEFSNNLLKALNQYTPYTNFLCCI